MGEEEIDTGRTVLRSVGDRLSRRRALRLAAGLLVTTVGLAGCDLLPESIAGHRNIGYRYRLTAIVDTPEGVRTGSSVIGIQWSSGGRAWGPMQGGSITQIGDAVQVDLPHGRKLFVLLTAPFEHDWPGWSLQSVYGGRAVDPVGVAHDVHPLPHQRPQFHNMGDLVDNWPWFVTFDDLTDPKSMRRVDPDALPDTFGRGYRFKGMTVQLTDDPVTRGIEQTLPWVKTADWPIDKNANTPIADQPIWGRVVQASFSRTL